MPETETEKKTFKENRKDRQDKRVERLADKRETEAKQYGIDLNESKNSNLLASANERKTELDAIIKDGVRKELLPGLEKIQNLRKPPEVEVPDKPKSTDDLTIKDVRKERRAKIADVLTSFAQGAAGQEVTPNAFRNKLAKPRLAEYEQYKNTSKAAKEKLAEWETNYINEQLDYLNQKIDDPKTSELEKVQLKKALAELENAKLRGKKTQAEIAKIEAGKDDDYNYITQTTQVDENTTQREKIDKYTARKKEWDSGLKAATKNIDPDLEQKKLELADMGDEGTWGIEVIDKGKRKNLVASIKALQEQRETARNQYIADNPEPIKPKEDPQGNENTTPEPTDEGNEGDKGDENLTPLQKRALEAGGKIK